jgi:hypothetical protein
MSIYESVFQLYAQLDLTVSSDRPVAISGLETRLADYFKSAVSHGIFEKYLHRGLLWQRTGDKRMKRTLDSAYGRLPSWSWMAYDGRTSYVEITRETVEWSDMVHFPSESVLEVRVRELQRFTIEQKDTKCVILDGIGDEGGWLKYDGVDIVNVQTLMCVVIGREKSLQYSKESSEEQEHYILVVKSSGARTGTYERIGVGLIKKRLISFKGKGSKAQII